MPIVAKCCPQSTDDRRLFTVFSLVHNTMTTGYDTMRRMVCWCQPRPVQSYPYCDCEHTTPCAI